MNPVRPPLKPIPIKERISVALAWGASDLPNHCVSAATACLYGATEAAVLAAGYAPAIGFTHTGKPLPFVYDIADIYKFETVVPVAFKVAASKPPPRNPGAGRAPGLPRWVQADPAAGGARRCLRQQ